MRLKYRMMAKGFQSLISSIQVFGRLLDLNQCLYIKQNSKYYNLQPIMIQLIHLHSLLLLLYKNDLVI